MSYKMIQARMKAIEAEFEEYQTDKLWAVLKDFIEPFARDEESPKQLELQVNGMKWTHLEVEFSEMTQRWDVHADGHNEFGSYFSVTVREEDLFEAGGVLRAVADTIEKYQSEGDGDD